MLLALALLTACAPSPEAPPSAAPARLDPRPSWTWAPGDDFAGAGGAVSPAGDVDGDGHQDLLIGAFRADGAGTRLGAVHLFLGSDAGYADAPDQTWWGNRNFSEWGRTTVGDLDVNGDGAPDMVALDGGDNRLFVFMNTGSALPATADQEIPGFPTEFGLRMAAGDFNGDGNDDLAVANRAEDAAGGFAAGRVRVYYGTNTGFDLINPTLLDGPNAGDTFGQSLAVGDVDGDGLDDLVVGAPGRDDGLDQDVGEVHAFLGAAGGVQTTAVRTWLGTEDGAQLGDAVASGGDVDGDGVDDVVMGSPSLQVDPSTFGVVSVFLSDTEDVIEVSASDFRDLGTGAALADTDGDGLAEVIGASFQSGWAQWSITGGVATEVARFDTTRPGTSFGFALAAFDSDNDGFDDLLVGAPDEDGAATGSGMARVFPGAPPPADDDVDNDGLTFDVDCDDDDAGVLGPVRYWRDGDNDGWGTNGTFVDRCEPEFGFVEASGDCDDADFSVNPAADERCGGVDEDCDGATDAGAADAVAVWEDADGDGWGGGASILGCPSADVALVGGDCDAASSATHPEAPELCDGEDNDCDGTPDDDVAELTHYADADEDGWGDAGTAAQGCVIPAGRVLQTGDCDDTKASYNPDQDERCAAGDEDCDGLEGVGASDASLWYEDRDQDGIGGETEVRACAAAPDQVATTGDCDDTDPAIGGPVTVYSDIDRDGVGTEGAMSVTCAPSAFDVLIAGDCNDRDPAVAAGFDEVCGDNKDNDCDEALDDGCDDVTDAEPTDPEPTDAEPTDAEPTDAEPTDTEPTDTDEPEEATDDTDTTAPTDEDDEKSGCNCATPASSPLVSLLPLAAIALVRRRRR
jgi:MYXO-CTERM domain-containing protein